MASAGYTATPRAATREASKQAKGQAKAAKRIQGKQPSKKRNGKEDCTL
jgi:hypothetical protein